MPRVVSMAEVEKHATVEDCWLVIQQHVYDLTHFLEQHPGGVDVIAKCQPPAPDVASLRRPHCTRTHLPSAYVPLIGAGRDGTSAFSAIHSSEVLKMLTEAEVIGEVDASSIRPHHRQPQGKPKAKAAKPGSEESTRGEVQHLQGEMKAEGAASSASSDPSSSLSSASFVPPPVSNCLNIADLEAVCVRRMGREGLDYYRSAADDEITMRENRAAFHRVFLLPRVLVNVKAIDLRTRLLGRDSALPLYISACALGKLAHPDGECGLARAAGKAGIVQMCPTLGSCSIEEMAAARPSDPSACQWFQLYVNANRETTLSLIRRAEAVGMQALCITVDAPVLGRRERDMRNKMVATPPSQLRKGGTTAGSAGGVARSITQFIDPALSWADLQWFQQNTRLPIVLKGIQTAEDAVIAVQHGVAGIVVSNHGGRQLDCARSGIEMLCDICDRLRAQGLWGRMEVFMDGGVRRGQRHLQGAGHGRHRRRHRTAGAVRPGRVRAGGGGEGAGDTEGGAAHDHDAHGLPHHRAHQEGQRHDQHAHAAHHRRPHGLSRRLQLRASQPAHCLRQAVGGRGGARWGPRDEERGCG